MTATTSPVGQSGAPMSSNQVKYYELLARYYVLKRQHMLAAHALLRLAERRSIDVAPCRPWIFFINEVFCFLKINDNEMVMEER